jgi:hypothetical protein
MCPWLAKVLRMQPHTEPLLQTQARVVARWQAASPGVYATER